MTQELMSRPGMLRPANLSEAIEFAKLIAKSKMVPVQYQNKPEDILIAVQLGAELGLAPLQSLQNIATINGKPSIYGDAALALVKASPLCEDVIEHIDGVGDTMVAICDARRRGKAPVVYRFSVADAKAAGLWRKAGPWTQYPSRMLQFRARGFALRDAFPDVLKGLITAEEAQDYPQQPIDVTPKGVVEDLDAFAAPEAQTALLGNIESEAREAAEGGMASLKRFWIQDLTEQDRATLAPIADELVAHAKQIDEQQAASPGSSPPPAEAQERAEDESPRSPPPPAPGATLLAERFGIRRIPPCSDCWPDGQCSMNCGPNIPGRAPPPAPGADMQPHALILEHSEQTAAPPQAAEEVGTAAPAVASPAAPRVIEDNDPLGLGELPPTRPVSTVYRRR